MLNPVPAIDAPLIVSAAVPLEVNTTDCVEGVFSMTFPNATLLELSDSAAAAAFSCRGKLEVAPAPLAVSVAVCVELTADTVAVNPALLAPEATVTEAGTETALLLLASAITTPPLGAAPVRATVQASCAAPVSELLLQDIPPRLAFTVRVGAAVEKVAICMTQGPEEVRVAVALLAPVLVTVLSSARSLSGDVMTRFVKPLPAPDVCVATIFAPKISSFAFFVVAEPLLALELLPLAPAVTSRLATPEYSRTRTSG